jgi:hypothetical protein
MGRREGVCRDQVLEVHNVDARSHVARKEKRPPTKGIERWLATPFFPVF